MDETNKFIQKYGKALIAAIKFDTLEMEAETGEEADENVAYTLGYFVAQFAMWAERKDPMFNAVTTDSKYIIEGITDHI